MGGHGFSLFSGMIDFHRQFLATVTYEGENALLSVNKKGNDTTSIRSAIATKVFALIQLSMSYQQAASLASLV